MFFMLCANFVMEQTSVEIKLPEAIAAKALDKNEDEPIFLNVSQQGKVLLTPDQREGDTDTLDNEIQVKNYMLRRAAAEKVRTGKERPQAVLILRVDKTRASRRPTRSCMPAAWPVTRRSSCGSFAVTKDEPGSA